MMGAMKLLLGAVAATAALAVPAVASAWNPQECAAWLEQHGTNHPDCQGYTPPPVETPPAPEPTPVPPVPVPPPNQGPVTTIPGEVTPVDTPEVLPPEEVEAPPAPVIVKGIEQTTPETQPVAVETGPTLPFSGLPLAGIVAMGLVLAAAGYAGRKALR